MSDPMSEYLPEIDERPMFGFLVERCEGCNQYRAGTRATFYSTGGSYWEPPDWEVAIMCWRCIVEQELSDFAGDVGMVQYAAQEAEENGEPDAAELRRDAEAMNIEFERQMKAFKARWPDG